MKTSKIYQVINDHGGVMSLTGNYSFTTKEAAIDAAKAFKENPRVDVPGMSDENVEYWKGNTYTVQAVITKVIDLATI